MRYTNVNLKQVLILTQKSFKFPDGAHWFTYWRSRSTSPEYRRIESDHALFDTYFTRPSIPPRISIQTIVVGKLVRAFSRGFWEAISRTRSWVWGGVYMQN